MRIEKGGPLTHSAPDQELIQGLPCVVESFAFCERQDHAKAWDARRRKFLFCSSSALTTAKQAIRGQVIGFVFRLSF